MRWIGRILGGCLAALICIAAGAGPADAQGSLIDGIKKRGRMQVAFGTFVPWAVRDKQGNWMGFEIDVATKLAKDMGVELELLPTQWDGIIPGLIASKYDFIIGGLSITPARQEQIDFTDNYSTSGQGVAANKALAEKLKWPEGYNDEKVTFVCRRGVAACKTIAERWPKATLRQFDDDSIAYQEVISGNAHIIMASEPRPRFAVIQNPDKLFQPTTEYITTGVEGMGVRKGNPEAIKFLNEWIAKNKTWLGERHTYWFKTRDWAGNAASN